MMICHDLKTIFIHCHKCAGNSIEMAVFNTVDANVDGYRLEGSNEKHLCINGYSHKYGARITKEYFVFSFVRNPWDRVISWLHFRDKRWGMFNNNIDKDVIVKELNKPYFKNSTYYSMLKLRSPGAVDFIGKVENLHEDMEYVFDKLNLTDRNIPNINTTTHKHYTEYYDDDTRRMVYNIYANDIKHFNYTFGD